MEKKTPIEKLKNIYHLIDEAQDILNDFVGMERNEEIGISRDEIGLVESYLEDTRRELRELIEKHIN